jgi:hypothetical protein
MLTGIPQLPSRRPNKPAETPAACWLPCSAKLAIVCLISTNLVSTYTSGASFLHSFITDGGNAPDYNQDHDLVSVKAKCILGSACLLLGISMNVA